MQFRDKVELIFHIFEARIRRPFDDKKNSMFGIPIGIMQKIYWTEKKIQENVKIE